MSETPIHLSAYDMTFEYENETPENATPAAQGDDGFSHLAPGFFASAFASSCPQVWPRVGIARWNDAGKLEFVRWKL